MSSSDSGRRERLAEADGNRTRLTGMPGHYGVEDRARHQTRYASANNLVRSHTTRPEGLGFGIRVRHSGYSSRRTEVEGGDRQAHRVLAAAAAAHRTRPARSRR